MTAAVDASPRERIERWGERLDELHQQRDLLAAELSDLEARQRAALLAEESDADPASYRRRARDLRTDLADLDGEIATLAGHRDADLAAIEAAERAERLAHEHGQAVAEVQRVAQDAAAWADRAVATFTAPVLEMDDRVGVLLAVAGEAGPLLDRQTAAAGQLATVLGKLDRYAPPPAPEVLERELLEPVVSRLPTAPPLRGLFMIARTGRRSAVHRHLAGLLEAQGD